MSTVKELLERFTYKPGWVFHAMKHDHEGDWISIEVTLENSYEPGTTTDIRVNSPVPPYASNHDFYEWLMWRLERFESHECREWFKVDGLVFSDPHEQIDHQLWKV